MGLRTLFGGASAGGGDAERARRRRFDVRGLFADPELAVALEQIVSRVRGVASCSASVDTGRLLVVVEPHVGAGSWAEVQRLVERAESPGGARPPSLVALGRSAWTFGEGAWSEVRRLWTAEAGASGEDARVSRPPWHAMAVGEIEASLDLSPGRGLTSVEARARLAAFGPNELGGLATRGALEIVANQVLTFPTGLLGAAFLLALVSGDVVEAGAIGVVVLSNVAVGYYTERRAEELLHAWNKLRPTDARVLRDGRAMVVEAAAIVPGDRLLLGGRDMVPADGRIVSTCGLSVDESTMTGESEPVAKTAEPAAEGAALSDRSGMVYAGTRVVGGDAECLVVATRDATELGAIKRELSFAKHRTAPLEAQLDRLGRHLAVAALGSSAAVLGLGALRGRPARELVRSAIALSVAAIPEGLPAVGTTALALVSQRLFRKGIVIRRLVAAETLGSVTVVCADKTGTLTENRMQVAEVYLPACGWARVEFGSGAGAEAHLFSMDGAEVDPGRARELARIAALNSDVELAEDGRVLQASGTEKALFELAEGLHYPVETRRRSARRVSEQRRSFGAPVMVTVHDHPELGTIELMKGAPELVLSRCKESADLDTEQALQQNAAMAGRGLRVLAFAWRIVDGETEPLRFAGLVGMRDPARQGVRAALERLGAAHVRVEMLTGDQERTALAVAGQLGIPANGVHSRVTPDRKLDVVRELQARGNVVAMTGDGVNDGPALKAADVGIAMGARGTDVARAVSDVILAHDDLPALVEAVAEGRALYDNVRRAIRYLVATNTSEILVAFAGAMLGHEPLGPLHLLWLNLLTDVAPALALAVEPMEPDVMQRRPRVATAPLFDVAEYRRLWISAGRMTGASLLAYGYGLAVRRGGRVYARTLAFAALVTGQLLHTLQYRGRDNGPNVNLDRVLLGSLALQAAALATPPLRALLGNAPLRSVDAALALGLALAAAGPAEVAKLVSPEELRFMREAAPSAARAEPRSVGEDAGAQPMESQQ